MGLLRRCEQGQLSPSRERWGAGEDAEGRRRQCNLAIAG